MAKGLELAVMLPSEQQAAARSPAGDGPPGTDQRAAAETEQASPGANEFFKGLTKEEWEEMKRAFNKDA